MEKSFSKPLEELDPQVHEAIEAEQRRQEGINLIASESLTSLAVRQACMSVLTNKYAEGYPHKRYYGGCESADVVENLAIERAKKLFGADHVNVQSHSGTQANLAVYLSALEPGDTILSMELSHGGHLSHGYRISASGMIYRGEFYTVERDTQILDPDSVMKRAKQTNPKMIVCGYSSYPRDVPFAEFRQIADEVGAYLLADIAHIAGMVGAGAHKSPVKYADFITTTTHKTLMGPRGAMIMCADEHAQSIDRAVFPGIQGGPMMHTIAAKAVCFGENLTPERKRLNKKIVDNARCLAKSLADDGMTLVSQGTDNHLMLVDLSKTDLTGKRAEEILGQCGITCNKNAIPYDEQSPFVTSGIRLGTPSLTIRGMGSRQMSQISAMITEALKAPKDPESIKNTAQKAALLSDEFPVYK